MTDTACTDHGTNRRQPTRRAVVQASAGMATLALGGVSLRGQAVAAPHYGDPAPQMLPITLDINGRAHAITVDSRTSLLDALREHLDLTGSKKGCDHGQCGACTVLVGGRRINSCLTLAVMHENEPITTIEGLASGDDLHPLQAAFVEHDGFQCGYCTPGQICSAVGMLAEAKAGWPSHVTEDLTAEVSLSDLEIRERMSGNICRCSAYPNIVAAIRDVAHTTEL